MREALIGIDIGTTAVKAVLADLEGVRQGEPQRDDVTLVVVKAAPGSMQTEAACG